MNAQTSSIGTADDPSYDDYLSKIRQRFTSVAKSQPLFTTDSEGLFEAYLSGFSGNMVQHHTCSACRQFIERFGGLVTIGEDGRTTSAIWSVDDAPSLYADAVAKIHRLVRRAKVTGVFLSSDPVWGQPITGQWRHFSVENPAVYRRSVLTAGQAMAEKKEDFKNVCVALGEFKLPALETAMQVLNSDALYRSEKVSGPAQWLHDLAKARNARRGDLAKNTVWRAIATAPAGFCHPRSSMIGTLLEDVANGLSFAEVSRRFADKMHPLRYQRPQAAPTAGAIAAAEKIVAQLGAAGSLDRRFCRLDEVVSFWRPKVEAKAQKSDGVFGHLQPKTGVAIDVPASTMTWAKFRETVLPTADKIEYYAAPGRQSYSALTTAVNADAPPILQWDDEDNRNPVAWYFWHHGSTAEQFRLQAGSWVLVDALTAPPCHWARKQPNEPDGVFFVLRGAQDTRMEGSAIFPETLKSEFHGIRKVIEAHSAASEIAGMDEPHAAGIFSKAGASWGHRLRVTAGGNRREYIIDRFD